MGIDNIPPKVFRFSAFALPSPVYHLFMLSLSQGILPLEWKIHKIIPIFKSGERNSVKNYRPISLLCCLSKVLEQIIYKKVIGFISPLISPLQFGFLRGRSTLHQLLIFFQSVFHHLDNKLQVDAIYLDISKAFDSVPHNELLYKLWSHFGLIDSLWNWLRAYLLGRRQCVPVNHC